MSELTPGGAGPLSRLRVLDLSTMIAAPLTASLLADYGADVVKVERPGTGDYVRRFGAQKDGEGLYWKTLSRNKRSVALDLHLPETQDLMRRWVPQFDVVIENFRPGTLERWGLAPSRLQETSPHLVVLRVTAYGQSGPYRDRPGFGTLAEAMTGLAALSGFPDRPPLLPAFPLADVMAGYMGAAAVLAAVERRRHTGEGDCIDLAIYEATLKLIELNILEYDQTGVEQERSGNRIGSTAPRGAYECADGLWLALSGSTQPVAERVLRTVGGDSLVEDPRFHTNADRVANAAELDEYISIWCKARDRDTAIREFTDMGCAVGPLETVETMLKNPQVVARESVTRVPDPRLGQVAMSNVFPRFATAECTIRHPGAVDVGEHTEEVLGRDLGLSSDELAELRRLGVTSAPTPTPRPLPPSI
jgi:crotonobetainyl-CoA:carnitine CoA-transferase CaiB-like acyl-CoA transferase